ncbi:hypothetical protein C1637_12630 [Chryseobacterium lactis]|uniref:Uncharacterized protein n=1 Tax=Chryseobacterium lactis TaxID=1241981 RepID=A0A3G6RRI7_CHRLC|nr:hypothetical protein EG342_01310 [Chryseobacterium lactis]AZB05637.1 hypothetical protein EG341_17435 [Chryseobacterium lactis]PNW13644.1 hypothetical protein C1637_12630 [Chryseobacterium lactis]
MIFYYEFFINFVEGLFLFKTPVISIENFLIILKKQKKLLKNIGWFQKNIFKNIFSKIAILARFFNIQTQLMFNLSFHGY